MERDVSNTGQLPASLLREALAAVRQGARDGALPSFVASQVVPRAVHELVDMMMAQRSILADAREALLLAQAIGIASHGRRHLWQDLGLRGRDDVSALLAHYFAPLFVRNVQSLKWKRFLYQELGALQGRAGLRPPGCAGCEEFGRCFPAVPA